jgi:hypothetical protein
MDLPEHIGNGPAGDGSGHELEEWVNDSSRQVAPPSFLRRGFFSSTAVIFHNRQHVSVHADLPFVIAGPV